MNNKSKIHRVKGIQLWYNQIKHENYGYFLTLMPFRKINIYIVRESLNVSITYKLKTINKLNSQNRIQHTKNIPVIRRTVQ